MWTQNENVDTKQNVDTKWICDENCGHKTGGAGEICGHKTEMWTQKSAKNSEKRPILG